jgi:uracil phosphoribosyltransferase
MAELHIIDHPLVQHKISLLRDKNTGTKEFRELVSEIAMFICYEATRDLPLKEIELETPLAVAKTKIISGRKLAFIPILRAGLGMVEGVTTLVPAAKIGHIGLFRDPVTKEPVKYYAKMPDDINERDAIIVDPMLATGNSAVAAITELKNLGVKHIKFMCIICSPVTNWLSFASWTMTLPLWTYVSSSLCWTWMTRLILFQSSNWQKALESSTQEILSAGFLM